MAGNDATPAASINELGDDYEISQNVRSYTASSDRVRYVLFAIIIASVFVFALYRNADSRGWIGERLAMAHFALNHRVWEECDDYPAPVDLDRLQAIREWVRSNPGSDPHASSGLKVVLARLPSTLPLWRKCLEKRGDDAEKFEAARDWAQRYNLHSRSEVKSWLDRMQETQVRDVLFARAPFLNIGFDVNDLSVFASLILSFLMLILLLSIARQHENLYLCLWKVKQLDIKEGRQSNQGTSKANLLYHALSMAQVFADPPTLARWERHWGLRRARLLLVGFLFSLPFLAMWLIVWRDSKTIPFALDLDREATLTSTIFELGGLLFVLFLGVRSTSHARACEILWEETFFALNPRYALEEQSHIADWLKQGRSRGPGSGRVVPDGIVMDQDKRRWSIRDLLGQRPSLVIFEDDRMTEYSADFTKAAHDAAGTDLNILRIVSRDQAGGNGTYRDLNRTLTRSWRAGRGSIVIITKEGKPCWYGWRPTEGEIAVGVAALTSALDAGKTTVGTERGRS